MCIFFIFSPLTLECPRRGAPVKHIPAVHGPVIIPWQEPPVHGHASSLGEVTHRQGGRKRGTLIQNFLVLTFWWGWTAGRQI